MMVRIKIWADNGNFISMILKDESKEISAWAQWPIVIEDTELDTCACLCTAQ